MVEMENSLQKDAKLKFENVKEYAYNCLKSRELDIKIATETFNNNDDVVKAAFDHTFRVYIIENTNAMNIEDTKQILDLAVLAAQKKLCMPTTPIFIINDLLSSLTIEKCPDVFCYLEDNSHTWKSDVFYSSVKNYLLRMCNDLLKRLSKSQNTVFSGRIHLFLAKLFPLNEKSGLNLMSQFSDNFTRYTTSPQIFEAAINKNKSDLMETDIDATPSLGINLSAHVMPVDYNLYTHFWSLQEFFSKPNTCFDKISWKTFTSNANDVLEALKSYKLEDVKDSNTKIEEYDDMNLYFSKYLTSEKLLDLQLNDSNFRRQILIQFLILLQYLNAEVKFKTSNQVLNEEQNSWCRSTTKKVNDLMKETPSNGSKFTHNVKRILDREEIWNKWKNEGCPNYVREKKNLPAKSPLKRPKPVSSDFVIKSNKKFMSDQSDIGKLCNINHDNLEACKDPNREFLPSLKEFFDEAIEQLDPVNQVEKQYYLTNQTDWAWKALRLLVKRSAFYFIQNQNVKTISEYLEAICNKLNKEFTNESQKKQILQQKQLQMVQEKEQKENPIAENVENDDESFQIDEDQNSNVNNSIAGQASTANNGDDNQEAMNTSDKNEYDMVNSPADPSLTVSKTINYDMPNSPAPLPNKKDIIDSELITLISENIENAQNWKNLATFLKMDEDTVSFIETETIDVNQQCNKILQLWKEREEKKAHPEIMLTALKSLELQKIAALFEERLQEIKQ